MMAPAALSCASRGCDGGSAAVYLVVLQVESSTGPTFLEGCLRIVDANGEVEMLLSSGTEDYFGGTCATPSR